MAKHPKKEVPKGLWATLKASAIQWSEHGSARTGAALAYYSVFSLGPLIVICIAIAGVVFDRSLVQKEVTEALRGLLGDKGSEAVNSMLDSAGKPSEGVFAVLIGSITLAFAAIGVVVQLKDSLNTIWGVTNPPGRGLWGFIRAHVFSLAAVLAAGFLLLISMLMTAALGALGNVFGSFVPESLLHATTVVVSFGVIALLFMLMFRYLPDAEVEWRDVWLGGLRGVVRAGTVRHWLLHRAPRSRIYVWSLGLNRDRPHLGLLQCTDRAVRRGIHAHAGARERLRSARNARIARRVIAQPPYFQVKRRVQPRDDAVTPAADL